MTKKIFLLFTTIFALFLCSSAVFANTDGVGQGISNAGNEIQNSWDKLGNSVQNAGNRIATGVSNMGKDETNNNNTGFMGMTDDNNRDGRSYTATRTATNTPTVLGMNGTMWTWFVFAILAVVVIALVWYYGMQQKDNTGRREQ